MEEQTGYQGWQADRAEARAAHNALLAEDQAQARRDAERAAQILAQRDQPRRPRAPRPEALTLPVRVPGHVVGSREITVALDVLRLQLNRHAAAWSKARRRQVETAVADLETALTDARAKAAG